MTNSSSSKVSTKCPHCGGALDENAVLRAGDYSYSELGGFKFRGEKLPISKQAAAVAGVVLEAGGQIVDNMTIARAIGTKSVRPIILIQVHLSRIKSAAKLMGIDQFPITNSVMTGLYWSGPSLNNSK